MAGSFLAFLAQHAAKILAGSILVGLALPELARLIQPGLAALIWLMLFASMLRIDWAGVGRHVRRPTLVLTAAAWLLVGSPIVVWLLVQNLDIAPGLAAALVLVAGSPPLIVSSALALVVGLDGALALLVMTLATFSTPVVVPLVALKLVGLDLGVDVLGLMARLAAFVGSCFVAALAVRRAAGAARLASARAALDGGLVIVLVVFAVGVMDGVTAAFLAEPRHVLIVAAAAWIANVGFQALAVGVFSWSGRMGTLTIGLCSGNRNLAVVIAVLPAGIHPDILLYFAMMQLPIYMLPALQVPLYRRVLKGTTERRRAAGDG